MAHPEWYKTPCTGCIEPVYFLDMKIGCSPDYEY